MKNVIRGGVDRLIAELDLTPGNVYAFGTPTHAGKSLLLRELFMRLVETEKPTEATRVFQLLLAEETPDMIIEFLGERIKPYLGLVVDNKRVNIADYRMVSSEELISYLSSNRYVEPGSILFVDDISTVYDRPEHTFDWRSVKQLAEDLKITIIATARLRLSRDFSMTYRDYRRGAVPTHEQLKLFKEDVTRLRVAGKIAADGIYAGCIDRNESVKSGKASFTLVDCSRGAADNTAFYITIGE